jgi:hypothetical protein
MKAKDKRLVAVLMSTNGDITEEKIHEAMRHYGHRTMGKQYVSTTEDGYQTVLIFEFYNDCATLKDRIGYRLCKLFTTARMKLNGDKILVTVVIRGKTDRFPMHGAFH